MLRIFSINGDKLAEIGEKQFPLEREIQRLTEANLHDLFELDYVKSQFELHGLRIDTLTFDKESRAFVIIEYKKDRNFSVVDQGMAYLSLTLNNKADFISAILSLGKDIEIRTKKKYIAFRRKQAFTSFVFLRSQLKAYLNIEMSQIDDPLKKTGDVKDIGHYSSVKTEIVVT